MCRRPSGGVGVAPWVLVCWVASEISQNSEMHDILILFSSMDKFTYTVRW